jgi:alpha-L-arabinofuranosidase
MTGDDPKAFNDWDTPDTVSPQKCEVTIEDGVARVVMPPMSIVVATLATAG